MLDTILISNMTRQSYLYSTIAYSRNKGVLRKEDYIFMRECLEKHLEYMQL